MRHWMIVETDIILKSMTHPHQVRLNAGEIVEIQNNMMVKNGSYGYVSKHGHFYTIHGNYVRSLTPEERELRSLLYG